MSEKEILLLMVKVSIIISCVLMYFAMSFVVVWVFDYKKTWQRIVIGIAALIFTPFMVLLIWPPVQYFIYEKTGKLD